MSNNIDTLYSRIKEEAESITESFRDIKIPHIYIGMATCGRAAGAEETLSSFEEIILEQKIDARIIPVGCIGHCYAEPIVIIHNPGFPPICYYEITPGKAKVLVKSFLGRGDPQYEYILGALVENDMIPALMEFPRFNMERRIVMEKCGLINPENIHHFIAEGGYGSLAKALSMDRNDVIDEVLYAGIRGRGGAGFPAGIKWEIAAKVDSEKKYVVCNADEGDPGAYMDRTIIESNPHQLLEGILICAYAVGSDEAYVYVRNEYPLSVHMIKTAIAQSEELGFIGEDILGSGFNCTITLFEGSGAFVCGEETALIRSIEGNRGMPRHRPPFPVARGLWGKPTVINNVKTFASIPPIIDRGGQWYRDIGTEKSPGTVIFSIVGDVTHAGLVEIPTGVTIRSLIFNICGGIPNKKKFKAVQIGGPSGGCLPESYLDTAIDFDTLLDAGAMMGSGGMVVMNEDTCMVDVARYFLEFTQNESCGKCTFCRIGTKHLLNILEKITKGEGADEDLKILEELSIDITNGSLCGLGKTAPNPVITSLRYFRDEYEAHIKEKRCPALSCRTLIAFYIDLEKCARGCDACVGSCPVDAIFTTKNRKKGIDQEKCVKCGECVVACPDEYDAVVRVSPPELAPVVERLEEKDDGEGDK